jgi:hypothetical protein
MSNERKSATLGMPHGTATHRLRKNILFHFLVRLNENSCFKCGQTITTADEMSIEHKLPWEGRSAELFWDLNNIAFSHSYCNVRHYNPGPSPKLGPKGTSWCTRCKKFEPVENFWRDSSHWNGLQDSCKKTKHNYRRKGLSACGEMANAEDLKPSAHNELTGSSPV